MPKLKALLLATTCVGIAFSSSASLAQATGQPDIASQDSGSEIVVTAQRRNERIQDVPVSVSALSGEALASANVSTLEDLSAQVPSLVATTATGYGQAPLSIRGVGGANGGANVFADEPVAVYMDGVFQTGLGGVAGDLLDIGSLQVLRGPQGTLFGRNATAGALLIESARPTFDFEGYVQGEAALLGDVRTSAVLSGPVVGDVIAARFAAGYSTRKGYAVNQINGDGLGGADQLTLRGSLLARPSDNFEARLTVDWLDATYRPFSVGLADIRNLAVVNPFVARSDLDATIRSRRANLDTPQVSQEERLNVAFNFKWDLGFAELSATTGYRHRTQSGSQESDGSAELLSFNKVDYWRTEDLSQELILSGDIGKLEWTIGGFAYRSDTDFGIDIGNGRATFALGNLVRFDSRQTTRAYAGFFNASLPITDGLKLTVGGRYSEERKEFAGDPIVRTIRSGAQAQLFGFVPPSLRAVPVGFVLANPPALVASRKDSDFSPRIVLDWRVDDSLLVYASLSEGFKSGGFNAFATNAADVPFDPEQIRAYEVGFKSDLFDRKLRFNVAAFSYDYSDLQVRVAVPTGGVNIKNAAGARVLGVEFETSFKLSPTLTLTANASVLNAEFTSGTLPTIPNSFFAFGTAIPLVQVNVAGNSLTRAPRFQGAVSVEKWWMIASQTLTARLSYRHQSSVFFLESNQTAPTYRQGPWGQFDASLTLASDATSALEASLYANNILNKRYLTQVGSFSGFPQGVPNDPATVGLRFKYRFGG
jgi:iron complex outermembrane recepter protein